MSTPSDWTVVLDRLEQMESRNQALHRQNRRMRRIGLVGLSLVGALLLLNPAQHGQAEEKSKKTIEAEEFVVKGPSGVTRATLNSNGLSLHNEQGKLRVSLFTGKDGSEGLMVFAADDQKQQILVAHTKEGLMAFSINDKNGRTRSVLATRADGKPGIALQDENGKTVFSQAQP